MGRLATGKYRAVVAKVRGHIVPKNGHIKQNIRKTLSGD